MFEQVLELFKEMEEQDELFKALARLYKKMFDALMAAGFTKTQALQIVASQGFGAVKS